MPTTASSPPDDLKAQVARWGEPINGSYRDVTIYETPAPTQGFAVLEMLNLLEPFELHRKPFLGPDYVHLMVQAKQLAYHDRDRHLADPRFADVPMERLISKAYADERRALMDPARALPWDRIPSYGSLTGDTVYIAAVDAEGNAASLIHSALRRLRRGGGRGPHRRGAAEPRRLFLARSRRVPTSVEPGKTPLHTLIASLAFRNDRLWAVLGCMGADGQPQIHMQAYIAMIDHGLDIQQALDMPRFLSGRFGLLEARDTLHIEGALPGRDHRRAGAARPPARPLGRLERDRRATPTASPSIRRPASWPAAPIRAATARRLVSSSA